MKLTYLAFDKSGHQVTDTIEAGTQAEAGEMLRRRGLYVTKVQAGGERPVAGAVPSGQAGRGPPSRRLKSLALLTSQLHVLVSCGTPLVEALEALSRQTRNVHLQEVVTDIQHRVEGGASLSAALEAHPDYFGPLYWSLVGAGEASGDLAGMLQRLASTLRKQAHVRNALIGAMIYPALLVAVSVAVLALMFTVVIPRFGELFDTLEVPLPPSTALLVAASEVLLAYWYAVLPAVMVPAAALAAYQATASGRRARETVVLALPQVGPIVRRFTTARIVRLLGVLLDANVPITDALRLTRRSIRSQRYERLLTETEDAVTRGETVSSVWSRSGLVSPSVQEIVRNGERSGQVSTMLLSAADFLDDENELTLRSLTSIVEPIILIGMGAVVGVVAVSLFMPLFDLTAMTQGGAP